MPVRRTALALLALTACVIAFAMQPSDAAQRTATAHHANGKRTSAAGRLPTPHLFDIHHAAGEPTIGITKEGYVVITAGGGCVTSCAKVGEPTFFQTVAPGGRAVFITKNKGRTWENISPGVGDISPHVTSLDPYLLVDRSGETSRIFDIDLNAACNELSYSDDFGKSWITNPLSCGEPVNDHQTVFSGKAVTSKLLVYPRVIYYCFNKLAYTDCTKSLDGGITFLPTANSTMPECSGLNGHGVTNSKGTIFIPYTGCGNAPEVAISTDEGDNWTSVRLPGTVKGGDPSIAVDAKDNLYYLWDNADRLPMLSTSKDGGKHWSKPINVAAPGVVATNLATLTVGSPGKVAIAYYGTTYEDKTKTFWNGYLAEGINVLGKNPLFYSASVNDPKHALKSGACGPGRCGRVLDFIDVEIAPDGTPWGAFVDACAANCEKTHIETDDDSEGVVGALFGGPNLRR